jgi:type I restriction enzyme, R subunit
MSERSQAQNPLIKYAEAIGWEYIAPREALEQRGSDGGLYLRPVLEEQLQRLNPGRLDEPLTADIIRRLNQLPASLDGNREMLTWLRGDHSEYIQAEKRNRNLTVIDYEQPKRNVFQVTDEWRYKGAAVANRADVMFLINGIPVALVETKAARRSDAIEVGLKQVRRYHTETPEMVTAAQVFNLTHVIKFCYGVTWNTAFKFLYDWRGSSPTYEETVKAFFDRERFLRMLREEIVFMDKETGVEKMILRQHQTRAVAKTIERISDPTKRRGLIWHTQGSGKTLTMLAIASRLLRDTASSPAAEKPTVLMIVDRTELEGQLIKNVQAYGIVGFEVANTIKDLQRLLRQDYRGLIVSMIHKFDEMPAKMNERRSIVVLVDEAHRTTGGDLGTYLLAALPNATFIGFTGTPIAKVSAGEGTFKTFGINDNDSGGYLDKYSIGESIEDRTTVSLNYALASSEMLVDRDLLEKQFLELKEAEGVSDIEDLNAVLDRAVQLREMMKSEDRVKKVAAAVAEHFTENVLPMGFKAFLVAVDREACVLYYDALKSLLPPDYLKVVISRGENDSPNMKTHYLTEDQERDVRRDFAKPDKLPKILIVTEKLLTGFDAPILYCMYLDKPMRDHVLLQAIARVNRPYDAEGGLTKPFGFVLDFVGIFDKLEKALAFDSGDIEAVIKNIDVLRKAFQVQIEQDAPKYLPLTKGKDDKALEQAILFFSDKPVREEFYQFFRQLQTLYNVLAPDAFLRPYIDDFQALAILYAEMRAAFEAGRTIDPDFTEKTKALLRENSKLTEVGALTDVYDIGPEALAKIKASTSPDQVKVVNFTRYLGAVVDAGRQARPYLISIGERAEALRLTYEERQVSTQEALAGFEKLAEAVAAADERQKTLGLDDNAFAVYVTLEPYAPQLSVEQALQVDALYKQFPDYEWSEQQEAELRAEMYRILFPLIGLDQLVDAADAVLGLRRVA